jgi:hypothetical protein
MWSQMVPCIWQKIPALTVHIHILNWQDEEKVMAYFKLLTSMSERIQKTIGSEYNQWHSQGLSQIFKHYKPIFSFHHCVILLWLCPSGTLCNTSVIGYWYFGTKYRSHLQVSSSSRRIISWTDCLMCCPETSVTNSKSMPHNIPTELRPQ